MGLFDPVKRTEMKDYEDKDGKLDWKAYGEARLKNGETCGVCGMFITFPSGAPTTCNSCKEMLGLDEDKVGKELDHDKFIRCPKCGYYWDPFESDDYDVLYDSDHDVICGECGHEFSITTHVSYMFTSPPMGGEDSEDEDTESEESDE